MLLLLGAISLGLVETTIDHQQNGASSSGHRVRSADTTGNAGLLASPVPATDANDTFPFRSTAPGDWTVLVPDGCLNAPAWRTPNQNLYFLLGNACMLLAFLASNGPAGQLWLRCMLCIGCVLLIMWGWMVECSSDAVLWSALFLLVNAVYAVVLLVRLRPVRFDADIEAAYAAMFQPLHVTRRQFDKVLSCMRVVRALKYQEVYAQEKVTKVDSLSLVLSGKLVVSQSQRALHIVFPHQFLDSPEWFGVSTDDYFQVSIVAMEDSRVLIWHRDKLKLSIMSEPFLETVFDHILGRDVVKKLLQVNQVSETMAASGNGFAAHECYDDASNIPEDKQPMLWIRCGNTGTTEYNNGGHGITALINRQLQDDESPLLDGQSAVTLFRSAENECRRNEPGDNRHIGVGAQDGCEGADEDDDFEQSCDVLMMRHRTAANLRTSMC